MRETTRWWLLVLGVVCLQVLLNRWQRIDLSTVCANAADYAWAHQRGAQAWQSVFAERQRHEAEMMALRASYAHLSERFDQYGEILFRLEQQLPKALKRCADEVMASANARTAQ